MESKDVYPHRLPDDEFFDEIIIQKIPRFKTSGMSGDEWRTNARVTFRRKGITVYERGYLDIAIATAFLPGLFIEVGEAPPSEYMDRSLQRRKTECMQPGCNADASHRFRLKHQYVKGIQMPDSEFAEYHVCFCAVHAHRGDSDYNDRDENLELISGDPATIGQIPPDDISRSSVINLDDF